jgi:hypothetical protein
MAIIRLPLSQPINTRDGTLTKDSKCVNGYFETTHGKREFVKRPGLSTVTLSTALPASTGQGIFYFNGYLYAVVNNVVYKIDPTSKVRTTVGTMTGTINGSVQPCYFVSTLNNTYLFLHNQVNGYTINGNTGAFVKISNDKVSSTTILAGGTLYTTGSRVIFGTKWTQNTAYTLNQQIYYLNNLYTVTTAGTTGTVPPTSLYGPFTDGTASLTYAGNPASGTGIGTNGIVTGITITNGGSGYLSAPSVSYAAANSVNNVVLTNTSGTTTLTANYLDGTIYIGMSAIGTGIPANARVTNITGTGPYAITISANTTSAVTLASFKDLNNITVTNTSGTNTITAASLACTLYVGMNVSGTGVPANTTITAITGTGPYIITLSNNTTAAVTLVAFKDLGSGAAASSLLNAFPVGSLAAGAAYFDTYAVVAGTNGQIYTSNTNDPTTWNGLNYITAQADPDALVGVAKHLNYILSFGTTSVEFFYDAGTYPGSPLANAPSYKIELGCANGNSIVSFQGITAWVGTSNELGTSVYSISGAAPEKISTPFIDRILHNSDLSNLTAYSMRINGHTFYVLTIYDLNVTIVYDFNEKTWCQWTSWSASEQYFKPSYFSAVANTYYLLDYSSGTLYNLSDNNYNDSGLPIYYRVVTDNTDSNTTKRKFYQRVEIIGDKIPAVMQIRHSDNDYKTWSNYRQVDLSKERAQIYQVGAARRRAWEFLCTDNQPLRLLAAEIDFNVGELEETQGGEMTYRS